MYPTLEMIEHLHPKIKCHTNVHKKDFFFETAAFRSEYFKVTLYNYNKLKYHYLCVSTYWYIQSQGMNTKYTRVYMNDQTIL